MLTGWQYKQKERKMATNTQAAIENQFPDAEHLWFWFISSRKIQSGLRRRDFCNGRPCELLDIEAMVTKLYLAGHISAPELEALKKYGELRRAPNRNTPGEYAEGLLWSSAMRCLDAEARRRGWLD